MDTCRLRPWRGVETKATPQKFPQMTGCVPHDRCDSGSLLDYSVNFTARKIVR
jgi:hypothetical protein